MFAVVIVYILKNLNTFRVESSLGAAFISLLSLFFIGLLFIAVKNFDSDIDIMTATSGNIKVIKVSESERILIQDWINTNNIEVPEGKGYRYLVGEYPNRPWLDL